MTVAVSSSDLLDHQIERLVELGQPRAAGLGPQAFRNRFAHLRDLVEELPASLADRPLPFVVVVPRSLVATEDAMAGVVQGSRTGYVGMAGARPLADYRPVDGLRVPDRPYLVLDVDLGDPSRNESCEVALPRLLARRRSPLTIDEGIAVGLQHPGILRAVNQYWLMGERAGDRRVPALWVSAGAPRLGWCWAGTPHDWLGAASCAARAPA